MRVLATVLNTIWAKIDKWFISDRLKSSPYNLYKARIMACVHLLLLAMVGLSYVLALWVAPPENQLSEFIAFAVVVALPVYFKLAGNLQQSGNLLALGIAFILTPMIMKTGGLYSDNLLWMMLCPLVVMLFSSKQSVFPWLFLLFGFVLFLKFWDDSHPGMFKSKVDQLSSTYFAISYILLLSGVILVVYLFKIGEENIIQDLQASKSELEKRTRELEAANQQLHHAGEQLQRSNRDLESFAYAASHDLKEPLRMIGIYTQLIQRKIAAFLNPDTEEMMGFVRQGVAQMSRLLDDVLEYSRVGRGQDKIKDIDLEDVVFYVRNSLKIRIEETGAQIIEEKPLPTVQARYSEMVQLFQNIIGNALKFHKPDLPPEIRISWFEKNGFYHVSVADNGIGIAPEFQKKVFNLFERLHGKRDYEGTGIGLATCKKIVENLGGEIWLESAENVGTTFFFNLPKMGNPVFEKTNEQELLVAEKRR